MFGCSVVNLRQHVGLQQLSALAGITHSSLGPNKKYKFIQDDASGESVLVCSCLRVLENLELTCAVGQLVYETLQAHQKVYNSGSGCLLFLAGAWSRAALECLHRGISVSHIISAMSEGIDMCIGISRKSSISVEGLGEVQSENSAATAPHCIPQASNHLQGTGRYGDTVLNARGQRKMKLSRHFCEDRSKNVSTASQPKPINIAHIAEGLRHGRIDAMNLVIEVHQMQSKSNQDVFDITKVVTCVLPCLPEEHACVLPGCVVLLSAEQVPVVHHFKQQLLKVVFISGDLSHTYRHLGFSRPKGIQRVSDHSALAGSSREEEWVVHVVALLLNLEVNLILVSGLASEKVIQRCCAHHILVVEKVKASALSAFAAATGGVPVTYATQLSKHCVGTGVKVAMWRDLSGGTGRKSLAAVSISTSGNSSLVTVILTSCVQSKLQVLEDQFWACAYRLHHALKDRVVLPGAGVTEMLCIHHLQNWTGDSTQQSKAEKSSNPYRSAVLHIMADGLLDYISTVMVNSGRCSKIRARTVVNQHVQNCNGHLDDAAAFSKLFSEGENEDGSFSDVAPDIKIYDNLSVKQEAWRKALDLVFLVLQTDAEVITGVDQKSGSQENLMLL